MFSYSFHLTNIIKYRYSQNFAKTNKERNKEYKNKEKKYCMNVMKIHI